MRRESAIGPKAIWPPLLIVLAVAAIGAWVRWLIATGEFLWLDELHTSWSVADSLGEVYERSLSGNQTPLYFWLTWLSVAVLGESEFSLRLVSLIAGVATIVAAAWLVLRWTGSTIAAVVAAILISLDVQFIYYATEARPYALIQFLGIIQVALFWRLISSGDSGGDLESGQAQPAEVASGAAGGGWRWLGLSLVTALLFYTQVTSAWLFLAEAVFVVGLLVAGAADIGKRFKHLLLSAVVAAVLCAATLPGLSQLVGRRSNWSSVSSVPDLLAQQSLPLGVWLLLPALALLIAVLSRSGAGDSVGSDQPIWNRRWKCRRNRRLGFVLLWALLPIVGVVALDWFKIAPMAHVRYTLVGAVAMPIFAGLVIGFVDMPKIRLVLAIALIAVSMIWSPITAGKFVSSGFDPSKLPGLRREDWQSPINEINASQAKRNHPVLLAANLIEDVDALENSDAEFQAYLRFPVGGFYRVENQTPSNADETVAREIIAIPTLLREHTRPSDIEKIKNSGGAWLIVRGTEELAFEIENEVVRKMASQYPDAEPLKSVGFASPHSHVYLISFDW